MKLRILNFQVTATHELISPLGSIAAPVSISDFDAFIYDPTGTGSGLMTHGTSTVDVQRRQSEIRDLIHKKGGIVVCVLRPDVAGDIALDAAAANLARLMRGIIRPGAGSQLKILPSARGASVGYFQVLKGALSFAAHLDASDSQIAQEGGTVFAVDSVGHPIAVEFIVGEGRICLLPPPNNIPADRMGAAIVKVVTAHFNRTAQIEIPPWAAEITVPGANIHDTQIAELTKRTEELAVQIDALRGDREKLLTYVQLLFGYGKAVLEPVVRSGFRLLGFVVPEPEEYEGEWDVELQDNEYGRTALGEVEGSEGVIDVDKYRQLLDYIEAESQQGRDHKGILIGNGFRLLAPDAPERRAQFSDHALRGAARNQFCLVPTTELFKAVCAVLESPEDQALKKSIRESLLTITGAWSFAREQTLEEKSPTKQNHALDPAAASSACRT